MHESTFIGTLGHLPGSLSHLLCPIPVSNISSTSNTACRRQQFGEGWFKTLKDVPTTGITMSIRQILKSACLIVSVPDQRKAVAVRNAVEGKLTDRCPSSILRLHPDCRLFLDRNSASLLSLKWVKKVQGG
jgi:6-phosphogluconolactonase/glucosamine-6-phosphate isomerase/deaminase